MLRPVTPATEVQRAGVYTEKDVNLWADTDQPASCIEYKICSPIHPQAGPRCHYLVGKSVCELDNRKLSRLRHCANGQRISSEVMVMALTGLCLRKRWREDAGERLRRYGIHRNCRLSIREPEPHPARNCLHGPLTRYSRRFSLFVTRI